MKPNLKLLDEILAMLVKHYGLIAVSEHYQTVASEIIKPLQKELEEEITRREVEECTRPKKLKN